MLPRIDIIGQNGNDGEHYAEIEQAPPAHSKHPDVWGMVMDDMRARDNMGLAKYGTRLRGFNGRDALVDAYQEALDLAVYLRAAIYERDNAR